MGRVASGVPSLLKHSAAEEKEADVASVGMRSDSRAAVAGGVDAAAVDPWVVETGDGAVTGTETDTETGSDTGPDTETGTGTDTGAGTERCGEAADDDAGDENLRARAAEVVALSGRAGG